MIFNLFLANMLCMHTFVGGRKGRFIKGICYFCAPLIEKQKLPL